jgi:hypothetical protein
MINSKQKGMRNASGSEARIREQVAYIHGRIEERIHFYADQFDINPMELVQRLGEVLIGAEVNRLPGAGMRTTPPEERVAVAEMEVVERAHGSHASRNEIPKLKRIK